MTDDHHIFLSYRSIEADFALQLAADLKNAGVNLWMDKLDGIRGGDDWRRQIEDALSLNRCALMIAVLSPEYLQADYCRNELARADRLKIPILPVLLYPVPDIPIEIERAQYIPFCQQDKSSRLERTWHETDLYNTSLQHLLSVLPSAQRGTAPDAETQYLTSLIAELESRKGVLEYVELSAQAEVPKEPDPVRPEPRRDDEWAAGFSMLVNTPVGAKHALPSLSQPDRIHFDSITQAVEQHPCFVLIGEPGAGKTTTIRRLALEAARKRLDNPRTAPLPLLLYLPQWGDELTPLDFVRAQWPLETDPFGLLAQGDILLYLDGLNEMGASRFDKARKLYGWFKSAIGPQRVIVTCRAGDYTDKMKLGDLPTVLAQAMDEAKIRQFATRYLYDKSEPFLNRILPDPEEAKYASPSASPSNDRSLFRLACNPYLLSALIFVYQQSPYGDLPRNNGALMRTLARALWERERIRRTTGWIKFEDLEAKFAHLAFDMIEHNQSFDMSLDYALKKLGDPTILSAARNANLTEVANTSVHFYHQLIQEYFAALQIEKLGIYEEIISRRSNTQLFQAVLNELKPDLRAVVVLDIYYRYSIAEIADIMDSPAMLIKRCLKNAKKQVGVGLGNIPNWERMITFNWDHIIIALCGISSDPNPIIARIADFDIHFAVNCVTSGLIVKDEIIKMITTTLISLLEDTNERQKSVSSLTRIGTPEALAALEGWRVEQQNSDTEQSSTANPFNNDHF